jgi:hypothetical protein
MADPITTATVLVCAKLHQGTSYRGSKGGVATVPSLPSFQPRTPTSNATVYETPANTKTKIITGITKPFESNSTDQFLTVNVENNENTSGTTGLFDSILHKPSDLFTDIRTYDQTHDPVPIR